MELYGHTVTQCFRCSGRETVDHLFQCPANSEYKRIFVYTMTQQLEKIKTIPAVAHTLVSSVAAWLDRSTIDHLVADGEMIWEIRNCLIAQSAIGWNLVLRGLLANVWAAVQETFTNKQDDTDRILGDSWSAKASLWIMKEARKLWLDHNVKDLYSAELKVAEAERWIFSMPVHDMLNKPVTFQAQWLAQHTKLIFQCAKEFDDLGLSDPIARADVSPCEKGWSPRKLIKSKSTKVGQWSLPEITFNGRIPTAVAY
jgi:hypothetical protein